MATRTIGAQQVLEFAMYPGALAVTSEKYQLGIDVEHNIERAELWTILVSGETM